MRPTCIYKFAEEVARPYLAFLGYSARKCFRSPKFNSSTLAATPILWPQVASALRETTRKEQSHTPLKRTLLTGGGV